MLELARLNGGPQFIDDTQPDIRQMVQQKLDSEAKAETKRQRLNKIMETKIRKDAEIIKNQYSLIKCKSSEALLRSRRHTASRC